MQKLVIGLFGFGTVGEGLCNVLRNSKTVDARIKKICIKHAEKQRNLPSSYFTTCPEEILDDPEINLIVELINGGEDSYSIVKRAMQNGKSVVTGNKAMLAFHIEELIQLQKKYGVALLYDASACGSIPVIRNLEEYYDNDLLLALYGIFNGSSNFILSKIFNEGMSYTKALKLAQELGFAEEDPRFDVDGIDSLYKLVILTVHAFGTYVSPDEVFHHGISSLSIDDIRYAREKNKKIKLIARVEKLPNDKITLYVMPKFVGSEELVYSVENEFNGVVIEGQFYDKQLMYGRGAGGFPTGSSVLSDITARAHQYTYEYKKLNYFVPPVYTTENLVDVYLRYTRASDLDHFRFAEISERYTSNNYSYVVGKIRLSNLLSAKEYVEKLKIFIAVV